MFFCPIDHSIQIKYILSKNISKTTELFKLLFLRNYEIQFKVGRSYEKTSTYLIIILIKKGQADGQTNYRIYAHG